MFLRRRKRRLRKSREGKIVRILDAFAIDAVCDIGANIGQTRDSLRAAGFRGRIVSFEPAPEAHATLVSRARHDPAWEIAPRMALGARAGEETYLSFLNDLHGWGFAPYMLIETNFSQALARQLQIDALFMRGSPPGR